MDLEIRFEVESDTAEIARVIEAAFARAEHSDGTEAQIVEALRRRRRLEISMVALDRGSLLGQVAISPVSLSSEELGWFGLGPVAVAPGAQKRGVGRLLVERALEELQKRGAVGCVVLGDPAYYARFGFRVWPSLSLPGIPPEYFQAMSFGLEVPTGEVAYDVAFGGAVEVGEVEHLD